MGEPDDPSNPNRIKPPKLTRDPEKGALEKLIGELARTILPNLRNNDPIPNTMREFLAYCFLSETGLMASEAMLVEHRSTHANGTPQVRYWYERRYPGDPVAENAMKYLEAQLRQMNKVNRMLEAKLKEYADRLDDLQADA